MCFRPTGMTISIKCPYCDQELPTNQGMLDECPSCGHEFTQEDKDKMSAQFGGGAGAPGAPGVPGAPGMPAMPGAPGMPKAPGQ